MTLDSYLFTLVFTVDILANLYYALHMSVYVLFCLVKDFDNENYTEERIPVPPGASGDFNMYPPVENTPDSMSAMPVVFEPLPDITSRLRPPQPGSGPSRLRPRVTQEARERSYSDDSLDDAVHRDNIQQKLRLQNILSKWHDVVS